MTHNTNVLIATERERWLRLHLVGGLSVTELARPSGFSRHTLHRWKRRYQTQGLPGLVERSRAHHHHPKTTRATVMARIRAIRRAHHFCAEKIGCTFLP